MIQPEAATDSLLMEEDSLDSSVDWREEEDEKTTYKAVKIRELFPANYHSQRQAFFASQENTNPHFCYKTIVSPEALHLHTLLEEHALKILMNCHYEPSKLPLLSQSEVLAVIE